MNYQIIWTKSAEFDLETIIEYIKVENIEKAKRIFFEIKNQCNNLSTFPKSKRIVPELLQIGISKYRELIYKRWRIIYKIDKNTIFIVAVIDSSRNLEDILFQRLLKDIKPIN